LMDVYLKTLGIATCWIGLLSAIGETSSNLMKLCSGLLSDYFRRRKIIMALGYGFIVLGRLFLAFSPHYLVAYLAKITERIGNGIQGTPRDAFIRDVAPSERLGSAYGIMRTLGMAGAAIGALVSMGAMYLSNGQFDTVFKYATVPAILAFVALLVCTKEPDQNLHPKDHQPRHPLHFSDIPRLGKTYWLLMVVVTCFTFARISEAFVILNAHACHLDLSYIPLVTFVYNFAYALFSFPTGALGDRINRFYLLIFGMVMLIISDIIFAFSSSMPLIFVGIFVWGIQFAITQNVFATLIGKVVPDDLRGTGFGLYYLITAVATLFTGYIEGYVADHFHISYTFMLSLSITGITLLILIVLMPYLKEPTAKLEGR